MILQLAARLKELSVLDLHFTLTRGSSTTRLDCEREKARAQAKLLQMQMHFKRLLQETTELRQQETELLQRIAEQKSIQEEQKKREMELILEKAKEVAPMNVPVVETQSPNPSSATATSTSTSPETKPSPPQLDSLSIPSISSPIESKPSPPVLKSAPPPPQFESILVAPPSPSMQPKPPPSAAPEVDLSPPELPPPVPSAPSTPTPKKTEQKSTPPSTKTAPAPASTPSQSFFSSWFSPTPQIPEFIVSRSSLDFGLNGRPCPILHPQTQTITISNQIKQKISYDISVINPQIENHKIEIFPSKGVLNKLESLEIKITLAVRYSFKELLKNQIQVTTKCGHLQKSALLDIEMHVSNSDIVSLEEVRQILKSQPDAKKIKSRFYIYLVKWAGSDVAIKHLVGIPSDEMRSEVTTYKNLRHPSIVYFMGHTPIDEIGPDGVYLIMESMFTTLSDAIHKYKLPMNIKFKVAIDIAKVMHFLHSKFVIHRDLKPQNLLMDSQLQHVKLADFGEAKETYDVAVTVTGTRTYMAPELLEKEMFTKQKASQVYDNKIDVYSFGIILNEMIMEMKPYAGSALNEKAVVNGERPYYDRETYERLNCIALLDLVHKCWHKDPTVRPTFEEITSQIADISAL
eukprot:TRINITY_DN1969_c0_g1_i1.p1 TRINITY_DN1969_c0_g1~~TRINITY_DN1969_c0_g1_i1.p1  ORF type:complete len:632 (+),score=158.64 TRINITY_DN1969_c0_g1_i1:296-2191(+)